jgi:hypothetical protein
MVCKILKDNYSSSLKSMSKTASPFLIILTITHIMEFVTGVAFVSVTWDVIWNLVTMTFLFNLHMVRMIYMCLYKPVRWQGSSIDGSWIFRHPGVLLFLWKFARRSKQHMLSCLLYLEERVLLLTRPLKNYSLGPKISVVLVSREVKRFKFWQIYIKKILIFRVHN